MGWEQEMNRAQGGTLGDGRVQCRLSTVINWTMEMLDSPKAVFLLASPGRQGLN